MIFFRNILRRKMITKMAKTHLDYLRPFPYPFTCETREIILCKLKRQAACSVQFERCSRSEVVEPYQRL